MQVDSFAWIVGFEFRVRIIQQISELHHSLFKGTSLEYAKATPIIRPKFILLTIPKFNVTFCSQHSNRFSNIGATFQLLLSKQSP